MSCIERLVRRWHSEQCGVLPPVGAGNIVAAFEALGSTATADVVELYERCGGMEQMDNNYWRLWSLDEITERNAEGTEFGPIFADYLIDSWCYRLKPSNSMESAVYMDYYNGSTPFLLATSLKQFLNGLWREPGSILEGRV